VRNRQLDQQLAALQTQKQNLEAEQVQIRQQLALDPNAGLRTQIDATQKRIAAVDRQLEALTVDLIPPQAMAAALRDMLVARKQLQLVSLANSPPVPAFQNDDAAPVVDEGEAVAEDDQSAASEAPIIYRHGLTLKVRGNYFDVLDYLRAIAPVGGSRNRFFWERIEYQVDSYPDAEVTMRVYTLGNREAWIGA
jgi:MSHA biogenesis protein MshJ